MNPGTPGLPVLSLKRKCNGRTWKVGISLKTGDVDAVPSWNKEAVLTLMALDRFTSAGDLVHCNKTVERM